MSGRSSLIDQPYAPTFQTPYTRSGMRPSAIDGEPPSKATRVFQQIDFQGPRSFYPEVMSPLIQEQLTGFEARAPYYLKPTELAEARSYICQLLMAMKDQNHVLAELAILRYYVEKDRSFTKPEGCLLDQLIQELHKSIIELWRSSEPGLPTGIEHLLGFTCARILILPSGTPNLIAGALAVHIIASQHFITGMAEIFHRMLYLSTDLLGRPDLRKCLEESTQHPIHANLHPLVRWFLCLPVDALILPHYASWMIIADSIQGTRQYTSPDCSVHAVHRAASVNPDSRLKMAEDYGQWFNTGHFEVEGGNLPIDVTTMIPPLSLEPSTDDVKLTKPENRVLQSVVQVASRRLSVQSDGPTLVHQLGIPDDQKRAFEIALAFQRTGALSHLNMAFHRLRNVNMPDGPHGCGRFDFFKTLMQTLFASLSEELQKALFQRLENRLWLLDIKHNVEGEGKRLSIDPRYSSGFTVIIPRENLAEKYKRWLSDCRIFFQLCQGKWVALDNFAALEQAVVDELDEAYAALTRNAQLKNKQGYKTVKEELRGGSFAESVAEYIALQLGCPQDDIQPIIDIGAYFPNIGLKSKIVVGYYGSSESSFIEITGISVLDMLCQVATALQEPLRSCRMLPCANRTHAMTIEPANFPIPYSDPAAWIQTHMIDRAKKLLEKAIPPQIIDLIQSGINFDISSLYLANPKITYQQMKDHLLAHDDSARMRSLINWAFHCIPTDTILGFMPLHPDMRMDFKSKCGEANLANGIGSIASAYLPKNASDGLDSRISDLTGTPKIMKVFDTNYRFPDKLEQPVYYAAVANFAGKRDDICIMRFLGSGTQLSEIMDPKQFYQIAIFPFKK